MSERDAILDRIRNALREPARGHSHGSPPKALREVLPAVGGSFAEQAALFAKNSQELRTDFRLVENRDAAVAELSKVRDANRWQKAATHRSPLTDDLAPTLALPLIRVEDAPGAEALETCDVGITECDALIAQTGSVLVTSRSAGGRALSVLPSHHVVLARREELVPDLPAAFALLRERYAGDYPSMISFITGPSRTGDIERILVLGAHGPKQLTVICW